MKYLIIIPDGLADEPEAFADGKTPLEAAHTPGLDWLGQHGRCGLAHLASDADEFAPEADLLMLMGFDPDDSPLAAGPVKAVGLGIELPEDAFVACASFVTLVDGVLVDPLGGGLSDGENAVLIRELNPILEPLGCQIVADRNGDHLLISDEPLDFSTPHPLAATGMPVANCQPKGKDTRRIRQILELTAAFLATHEINAVRRDLGESPATDLWLWSPGEHCSLPPFPMTFGLEAAAVGYDPLFLGLTRQIGLTTEELLLGNAGVTEGMMRQLTRSTQAQFDRHDLVCLHIDTIAYASLAGSALTKTHAIEAFDHLMVTPLLEALRGYDQWRMLVVPSFSTSCESRRVLPAPSPFVMAGEAIDVILHQPFTETAAIGADMHVEHGQELMEYFLTIH
jgi:2,3-bisphosphoglycerate-independent phosphoglycerate mutase